MSHRSGQEEQEGEMWDLNRRLALYIERVWALEADKAALQQRLAEAQEGSSREEGALRQRYENELAEARRARKEQAVGREALQAQLRNLRQEHQQLLARNLKKENELSRAATRMKSLDAQLIAKKAELATSLSRQCSLEKDLEGLNDQTLLLKGELEDVKGRLQSESLSRANLEIQMKTVQEQVTFLKNLHEHELKSKKEFYELKIKEVASGHQQKFKCKVLDALQELRRDHKQQILEYKDQLEQSFSAQIENAQSCAAKNSDLANSAWKELSETKQRADALARQNAALEAKIRELETRAEELQKALDSNRDLLAEKDRETEEMQQQIQAGLEEYKQLLDVKLGLDFEIGIYRTLLEQEEERLSLSRPSPETAGTWVKTNRGKKRKRPVVQAHTVVVLRTSAVGSISIENIDAGGKFIDIKNNSKKDLLLGGWTLRRQNRQKSDTMFKFPARFVLQAGQVITIWGPREGSSPSPGDLVWRSQMSWTVGENMSIALINANSQEAAAGRITYVDRGKGSGEMDDDFERGEMDLNSWRNESHSCPIM